MAGVSTYVQSLDPGTAVPVATTSFQHGARQEVILASPSGLQLLDVRSGGTGAWLPIGLVDTTGAPLLTLPVSVTDALTVVASLPHGASVVASVPGQVSVQASVTGQLSVTASLPGVPTVSVVSLSGTMVTSVPGQLTVTASIAGTPPVSISGTPLVSVVSLSAPLVTSVAGQVTVTASIAGTPNVVASVAGLATALSSLRVTQADTAAPFTVIVMSQPAGGAGSITGSVWITQADTTAPLIVIVASQPAGGAGTITGSVVATILDPVAVTQATSPWVSRLSSSNVPLGTVQASVTGPLFATVSVAGLPLAVSVVSLTGPGTTVTSVIGQPTVTASVAGVPTVSVVSLSGPGTVVASVPGQVTVTASIAGVPSWVGSTFVTQADTAQPFTVIVRSAPAVTQGTVPWVVQVGSSAAPIGTVVASVPHPVSVVASVAGLPLAVSVVSHAGPGTTVTSVIGQVTVTASVPGVVPVSVVSQTAVHSITGTVVASIPGVVAVSGALGITAVGSPVSPLNVGQYRPQLASVAASVTPGAGSAYIVVVSGLEHFTTVRAVFASASASAPRSFGVVFAHAVTSGTWLYSEPSFNVDTAGIMEWQTTGPYGRLAITTPASVAFVQGALYGTPMG